MYELRRRLRLWLSRRVTMAAANLLVVGSVLLLFVLRLVPLPDSVESILEVIDTAVLIILAIEFLLRLLAFGGAYFIRDFGWVDLLSVVPLLAPLFSMVSQLRALRIARLIRLVRIIRIVRLVRALDEGGAEHLQMKARFYMAISSTTMLFLLATAIGITLLVDRSLQAIPRLDADLLLNRIELVIMSSAVLAAIGITATASRYLSLLVTGRIASVNRYLDSVLQGGNKLPIRTDDLGDEITELQRKIGRISNVFVL